MEYRKLLCRVLLLLLSVNSYSQIDWQHFMANQDMTWNRLPQTWYEAPFIGNGSLGSYLCVEPGQNAIRVDVGNSLVHDHRTDDRSIYGRSRLLIGHFLLHPVGKILSGEMRLDLWNASAYSTIRTTAGEIRLKACVTSEFPYILVEAEATTGERGFAWQFCPDNTDSPRLLNAIRIKSQRHLKADYVSNPPSKCYERHGISYCWQPLLEGGGTATAWREWRSGTKSLLAITNAHSYPEEDALEKAETALAYLQEDNLSSLWEAHRRWWHRYYQESFISLPDKKMENFYWAQMYKLASATRIGGGLLDNSGPWQVLTPWPNSWWNLNMQLSYWPVYTSNRLELGMPLVDVITRHMDNLIRNVPVPYRKDAAALPVATDFELVGVEVNVPGGEKIAQVGNLPWICHNLWLHYRYSMDERILRNTVYPTLRRAINFYLPFLEEDSSGSLHLKKTYSPEYGSAEDCNYDLALLKWGCQTLLESCEILSINDSLSTVWQRVLDRLVEYPQNEKEGIMIGKEVPFSRSHRHFSHLLMFYPLHLLHFDQPGSRELMEKSVEHWHSLPGNILGFSYTGASLLYASFGNGDKALEKLEGLFQLTLRPNTMYMESGPVIETPLSGAQCIHEMLLQSWGKKIRVFPAVPSAWRDVQFQHLRTEGAFLVSAIRRGGKTVSIEIESLSGESCLLQTDMENPVVRVGSCALQPKAKGEYLLNLKRGETVIITSSSVSDFQITPVEGEGKNFFGLK